MTTDTINWQGVPSKRRCSKCDEEKEITAFPISNPQHRFPSQRFHAYCKDCKAGGMRTYLEVNRPRVNDNRRRKGRAEYCSDEQYNMLKILQSGKCAICNRPQRKVAKAQNVELLSADHCHETMTMRELLCNPCNRVLGLAEDNSTLLRAMADYIDKHCFDHTHNREDYNVPGNAAALE